MYFNNNTTTTKMKVEGENSKMHLRLTYIHIYLSIVRVQGQSLRIQRDQKGQSCPFISVVFGISGSTRLLMQNIVYFDLTTYRNQRNKTKQNKTIIYINKRTEKSMSPKVCETMPMPMATAVPLSNDYQGLQAPSRLSASAPPAFHQPPRNCALSEAQIQRLMEQGYSRGK